MRQQLVISTAGSNTIPPYVKHSPKQGTSNDSVTESVDLKPRRAVAAMHTKVLKVPKVRRDIN